MKILLIMEEAEERRELAENFTENMRNVECFEASMGTEALFIMKKHTKIGFTLMIKKVQNSEPISVLSEMLVMQVINLNT